MFMFSSLRACPIPSPYSLCVLMLTSTGWCLDIFYKSTLLIVLGHLFFRMFLRHFLTNTWASFMHGRWCFYPSFRPVKEYWLHVGVKYSEIGADALLNALAAPQHWSLHRKNCWLFFFLVLVSSFVHQMYWQYFLLRFVSGYRVFLILMLSVCFELILIIFVLWALM